MYKRILLASDGARESLVALREGALIARALAAEAFLLIVEPETAAHRMADGVHPVPRDSTEAVRLLKLGLDRLTRLGVPNHGQVVFGEPGGCIAATARAFHADLIVVGHRRRSFLDRWWSSASGGYIVDSVDCSLLVARDTITDQEFEAYLDEASAPA